MKDNHKDHDTLPHSESGGGFLNGLMLGAVIGAAGYYFFGTEEGKKMKDELLEKGKASLETFKDEVAALPEKAETVKEKVQETGKKVEVVKKQSEKKLKQVKKMAEKELKVLEDGVKEAKKKAEAMQKQLEKTASKLEKKFFVRKGRTLKK